MLLRESIRDSFSFCVCRFSISFSLVDIYDALVTKRVYKAAYEPEKAYQMIINGHSGAFGNLSNIVKGRRPANLLQLLLRKVVLRGLVPV